MLSYINNMTSTQMMFWGMIALISIFSLYRLYRVYKRNNNKLTQNDIFEWIDNTKKLFITDITIFNQIVTAYNTDGVKAARRKISELLTQFVENTNLLTPDQKRIILELNNEIINSIEGELVKVGKLQPIAKLKR